MMMNKKNGRNCLKLSLKLYHRWLFTF